MIIQRSLSIIPTESFPHCIDEIIFEPSQMLCTCKGELLLCLCEEMPATKTGTERMAGSFQKSKVQYSSYAVGMENLLKLKNSSSLMVIFPCLPSSLLFMRHFCCSSEERRLLRKADT